MKISKLFHWLYAILMLLPILVFIPTAFYYGFNEHAVAQEKTEQVPVYYESNEVNSASDLLYGNVYYYSNNLTTSYRGEYNVALFTIDVDFFKIQFPSYENYNISRIDFCLQGTTGNPFLWLVGPSNTIFVQSTPFYMVMNIINSPTEINTYVIGYIYYTNSKFIKDYQPLTTNMSITDSMAYAWHSVWQNDLFSWSYDSFLTQPFLYITNLFNVPPTNTLLYCLSYWLNISIIWLVFDLIMYVPLLVHRWIDKGIIE